MTNLLAAQFSRLFKSKIFYISLIFLIGTALYFSLSDCLFCLKDFKYFSTRDFSDTFRRTTPITGPMLLESYLMLTPKEYFQYFQTFYSDFYTIYIYSDYYLKISFITYGIISAILISTLIGADFGSSTVRNKIIAGYSRKSIYTSNLIVCIAAEIIMQAVYIITKLIPAIIVCIRYSTTNLDVHFSFSFKENVVLQIIGLGIIVTYSSIFLFITMTLSSRSRAAAASLLTMFFLIIIGMQVSQTLYPFEYNIGYYAFKNGYDTDKYDNYTDYKEHMRGEGLSKTKNKIYGIFDDILLTRQANYLNSCEEIPPRAEKYILYDFSISAIITAAGLIIFSRKDLN